MEIKSNKTGVARSSEENRLQSKALQAKAASVSQTAMNSKQVELKEGQSVKGQILDLRYNEARIQLEPGKQIVTARLSGDVPLAIGEEARFVVTENSANHLVLKLLPADTTAFNSGASDVAILKALTASGLPQTERNKAIIAELLSHRMPVDKQTLQTLAKAAVTNRDASPQNLVLMYKNHIPLTAANVRQFDAYQNGTSQLLTDIKSITTTLSKMLGDSGSATEYSPGVSHSELSEVPNFIVNREPSIANDALSLFNNTTLTGEGLKSSANQLSDAILVNDKLLSLLLKNNEASNSLSSSLSSTLSPMTAQAAPVIIEAIPAELYSKQPSVSSSLLTDTTSGTTFDPTLLSQILTEQEQNALTQLISSFSSDSAFYSQLSEGKATLTEVFQYINQQLPQAEQSFVRELIASPEYSKLITEAFHQKWTLKPEALSKKASVSELYQNLQEDMEELDQLIKLIGKGGESIKLSEPIKNVQDNLQFMKDLNQLLTYVQLPVQFKNQDIHSDLYVFTNKKALQEKKNLSVLLHLDMPSLGSMNIHVSMDHNLVSAKFYLEGEETIELVEKYLPSLKEALQKKGYSFTGEVLGDYHKPDFTKDFLDQNTEEISPVRYSFDIRA